MKQQVSKILPFQENTPQAQASALPGAEPRTGAAARRERKRAEAARWRRPGPAWGRRRRRGCTRKRSFTSTARTRFNALAAAREDAPDVGFMARLLALCTLPRTNPGTRLQYKRVNGPYTLVMSCASTAKLPYGTLPRLLLAWVCSEAVRTQSRELVLGASLAAFMRKLGIYHDSGGTHGVVTRLRHQIDSAL